MCAHCVGVSACVCTLCVCVCVCVCVCLKIKVAFTNMSLMIKADIHNSVGFAIFSNYG